MSRAFVSNNQGPVDKPAARFSVASFFKRLGPGLITGASDDDPSGIATYSQAGAVFGFGLLWTTLFSLPLMAAIQEISARIGRVTGRGIAGNIRVHYPRWLLYPVVFLLVLTNTVNLGADLGAMGDATALLVGGPARWFCVGFALLCVGLETFSCYSTYSRFLKWLTLALFSYVATVFLVHVPWVAAIRGLVIPSFERNGAYWATFIGVLGTTISPYLFFWQASMECEEIQASLGEACLLKQPKHARAELRRIRFDTYSGMSISNLVAFFIILAAAVTLHVNKITDIQTSAQAAEALRPLAGRFTFVVFSIGIIGTGLLAVPVLAGSAAYAVGEAMQWPTGLDRKPLAAKGFYTVLTTATLLGLAMNFQSVQKITHLSPIKSLYWSAVLNGVVAVPVMVVVMLMHQNPQVMGGFVHLSRRLKYMGWLATLVMAAATVGMLATFHRE